MNRFLKLACLSAVLAGIAAIPANAESQAENAVARPDAPGIGLSKTTSWGCCWIYFNGRWICIPCG
jgi:hypothetical protein